MFIAHMVQTCLNRIFQEVAGMDSSDQVTFIGEKTVKELVMELLKKRRDAGEFRS